MNNQHIFRSIREHFKLAHVVFIKWAKAQLNLYFNCHGLKAMAIETSLGMDFSPMRHFKMHPIILTTLLVSSSLAIGLAQPIDFTKAKLSANKVYMSVEKLDKKTVVKVAKDSTVKEVDEPTFVKLGGIDFKEGTIEVNVLSKLLPDAPEFSRGFIGVAFHINDDNSKFECIYIRPTNGRADDQVRRNHSIQYFSYPDYKFTRLRKESPEKYESYADMGLNEWIKMKIVVKGREARLYLNDDKQPSLVVTDLKLGESAGSIGLFVDVGTEGYFSDLKISK